MLDNGVELMLLVNLTLLSFISALLPIVLKPLWMCIFRQSSEEKTLYDDIFNLKLQQKQISMKDNFAAHAKLQRKIIVLEDSRKELSKTRVGKNLKIRLIVTYGLQIMLGLVMFIVAFWYRYTPLVILKESLFPFQNLFSYPIHVPNAISPHAWVVISRLSFASLFK